MTVHLGLYETLTHVENIGWLPFGLKSNGKVIFRKFRSEIVEYSSKVLLFSIRNEKAEIPYHLNESSVSRPFPARVGRNP